MEMRAANGRMSAKAGWDRGWLEKCGLLSCVGKSLSTFMK